MYKEVEIGKKVVPMLANGATPIRYKMTFGGDLLLEFQQAEKNGALVASSISQLAFIMAKAAEKADMTKLNVDKYAEWLEQFEPLDLTLASEDIVNLYMGNMESTSEVKKKVKDAVKDN